MVVHAPPKLEGWVWIPGQVITKTGKMVLLLVASSALCSALMDGCWRQLVTGHLHFSFGPTSGVKICESKVGYLCKQG